MSTLFERLGGEAAVDAAVDLFYDRVLADYHIARFFTATDMDRQKRKQKMFLTMAFGGPNTYDGRTMEKAHADLVAQGLADSHVDAVAGHLQATLEALDVPTPETQEVMTLVGSLRDQVLGRATTPA